MGETHVSRRISPMQEQAKWRTGFPGRDVHRARKRHHAGGGGPIVELPGRSIMMIEAAQIAGVENPIEIARCESRILAPQRRRLPSAQSGVNCVDLDIGRRRIVMLAPDQCSFAQVGERLARKPHRHVEPYQPEVTPDKALFRICDRGADPVSRIGLEVFVTDSGWRPPAGVLPDHPVCRGVGHPACSSTSWIGSAKISSARSS